ncbi:MAG: Stp1/IreP family PP2C-type Ser/Thr phosphatase [Desulfobacterales bacterium]
MTNALRITSWGQSDVGLKRPNNEDSFHINDQHGYYALADGMGGEAAGEVASGLFVAAAEELIDKKPDRNDQEAIQLIETVFTVSNARILDHVRHHPHCEGMGCTAELLIIHNSGFSLGHVGDSRTYRLRNGTLQQLTKDHSLVQQQLDEGLISLEESEGHPLQNVIIRAVGIEADIAVDIVRGNLARGDLLLLCSDGLSDMIYDSAILEILQTELSPQQKADRLIEKAKSSGGNDNITVVVIDTAS